MIYKTLALTGLRRGELASITVGQLELDGPTPYLVLRPADEKNRTGSSIPLRPDLAVELGQWIIDKSAWSIGTGSQAATIPLGKTTSSRSRKSNSPLGYSLPADVPLFDVPSGLIRILDRDLQAAGIAKRDERGRTVDVHAMRHTFITMLSKAGVSPRTAQAAARHSSIDLTMNVLHFPKASPLSGGHCDEVSCEGDDFPRQRCFGAERG